MLLLLMLNSVVADAGYHYDVPMVAFHLPSERPANFRSEQSAFAQIHKGNPQSLPSTQILNGNSYQAVSGTNTFNSGYASTTSNLNSNGPYQSFQNSANSDYTISQNLLPPNLNSEFIQSSGQGLNNLNFNSFTSSGAAKINNGITQTVSAADAIVSNAPSAPPVPTVIKHVYFHVPPPDIEEQRATPLLPPPKKTYKIIFIKVPSQETSNTARLQQLMQSRNGGVEEKTLIYVLVKKPESQQSLVVPQRTNSNHEVFFVKYNGNPDDIASQINDGLKQSGSAETIVPISRPGFKNSHNSNEDFSLNH